MSLQNLEKGLKIYYATFKRKYDNKFTKALEDSGMDDIYDLALEFTSDAADFTMSDFDEKCPLGQAIENEDERSLEIFRICNHCYKHGQPPIHPWPPRSPAEKIPYFYWYQDMNLVRMRMKFLSQNLVNCAPINFQNEKSFQVRITAETFYVHIYGEYELRFNFWRAINPNRVQFKKSILGKMIDFVFEKSKPKYWEHLLIDYHRQMYKQQCKIDWDNFLDKDEAIKMGTLDEEDRKDDTSMQLVSKEYTFKNINHFNSNIICLDEEFNDIVFELPESNKEVMEKIKKAVKEGEVQKKDVKITVSTVIKNDVRIQTVSDAKIDSK